MVRRVAVLLAAILMLQSAVCPLVQAAGPFPEEILERPASRSHVWAYVSLAVGAGLVAGSFSLAEHGNDTYDDYLAATDSKRITDLYDRTQFYDRLASGSLIAGEVLIGTGLYLRFLRPSAPIGLSLGPARCAVALRF